MKKTLYLFLLNAFVLYAVDYNVSTFDDFLAKLNSMTADDTIILNNNIESNNNRDLTPLNLKGTIRGNGHTLHIESKPVVLAGNTKLDDVNLTIKPATSADAAGLAAGFDQMISDENPRIVMNGHDLILHNVVSNMDAKHGKNANNVKPSIVMGKISENSSGLNRENTLTISGDKELVLNGIITGSVGSLKEEKSIINIENSNAKLRETSSETPPKNKPSVVLGSINGTQNLNENSEAGAVEIKTNSRGINNFEQDGKNNVTMEVNNVNFELSSKLPHTLQNLRLNGTSEFKTKNLTVDELHIEDNSKILIEPQPSVPDTGKLNIKTLNGDGTIETRNGFDDPASVTIEKITGNPKVIAVDNKESKLILPAGYEPTENGEIRRTEENAEQPPAPAPQDSENENDGDSPTTDSSDTNGNNSDSSSQPSQDPPVNNEDDKLQGDDPNAVPPTENPSGENSEPKNDKDNDSATPPKNDTEADAGTINGATNNGSSESEDSTSPKTDVPENNNGDSATSSQDGTANNNDSGTSSTGEDSNTEDSAKDTETEEEQGENTSDSQDETSDKENQDDKSNNPSDEVTDTVENNDIEAKKVEQKYEDFKNLGTKIKANVNLKLVEDSSYLLPAMASYSNQLLADRIKRNIEEINKLETSDNIWVKTPSTRGRLYKDIKYSDNTVLVGAEKASSDNLKVGFAVGIGEGKEKLENSKFNHNNKINTTEFYHYGEYEKNNNKLSYQLGLGFAKTKTQRKIANNNVFAKYNSNVFSTGIGYSYKYDFKNISVEPTLNLNYVLVKSNSYKENGNSPYKLNVQKNNYNDMNLKTAIRAVWNHNKFSASIETGLTFNLLKNKENLSYTLVEDESVKLNLENYKKEQVHGNIALGVGYKVTENAQVFLKYETKVSKHNKSQSGMIGFKYTF